MTRDTAILLDIVSTVFHPQANLAIVVFTNLGSETGRICKPQLRRVTTPKCCEAVSPSPTNKTSPYNGLRRCHTVDLSPQFRKGNFDSVG
jgi:hypothetical protein